MHSPALPELSEKKERPPGASSRVPPSSKGVCVGSFGRPFLMTMRVPDCSFPRHWPAFIRGTSAPARGPVRSDLQRGAAEGHRNAPAQSPWTLSPAVNMPVRATTPIHARWALQPRGHAASQSPPRSHQRGERSCSPGPTQPLGSPCRKARTPAAAACPRLRTKPEAIRPPTCTPTRCARWLSAAAAFSAGVWAGDQINRRGVPLGV
jgi:hypothetical protein